MSWAAMFLVIGTLSSALHIGLKRVGQIEYRCQLLLTQHLEVNNYYRHNIHMKNARITELSPFVEKWELENPHGKKLYGFRFK